MVSVLVYRKLNRLIEVRYSSVPSGKVVQPPGAKGITAEVWEGCPVVPRWAVREDLPDCHKNLCEALSMAVRYARCAPCRIPMNRLTKRFIFYSPTGRAFPEIEKRG